MKLPITLEIESSDTLPFKTVTFRYPIAWDKSGKPTHFQKEVRKCGTVAVHDTRHGFKHVLRVFSIDVPPPEPPQ